MACIIRNIALKLSEKIAQRDGFIEYNIEGFDGGRVVVVSQIDEAEKAIKQAEYSTDTEYPRGIGLDVEYKAIKTVKPKPGTIQLSFPDVTILLLVSQMKGEYMRSFSFSFDTKNALEKLPEAFVSILANESYAKVGVAVKGTRHILLRWS